MIHALEFTIKLLLATLLFLPRKKRNPNYWSILLMTGLAVWIMSIAVDEILPRLPVPDTYSTIIHFATSYFMIFVVVMLSHSLGISESLYAANTGFAIVNAWHCIASLLLLIPGICRLSEVTVFAEDFMTLPFLLICWGGTLELRKREIMHKYRRPVVVIALAVLIIGLIRYDYLCGLNQMVRAYLFSLCVSLLVIVFQYGFRRFSR